MNRSMAMKRFFSPPRREKRELGLGGLGVDEGEVEKEEKSLGGSFSEDLRKSCIGLDFVIFLKWPFF